MHAPEQTIEFLEKITSIPLYALFLGIFFSLLFFYKKRYAAGILLVLFDAINHLSVFTLKNIFSVPRPDNLHIDAIGYAFPSGHAAGITFIVFSFFFSLNFFTNNKALHYFAYILGLSLIIFIGWSRIYLGAHTMLELYGGFFVGFFWAYAYKKTSYIITKK